MTIKRSELSRTKFGGLLTGKRLGAVHPGEILRQDFIEPLELTRYRVAKSIRVPQRRIDEICAGKRAMTADTALRLGRLFGVEPQLWMNLQSQYDLEVAELELREQVDQDVEPLGRAA